MQNASASTHVLQANFFHYQYIKGHTIMQHITAIEGMAQQLDDLNQSMSQSQIMTKIVSTLPSSYRHFMTVWDNLAEADKTMPHLITKLMNEQHRELNTTEVFNQPKQAEALLGVSKHPNVSKPGKEFKMVETNVATSAHALNAAFVENQITIKANVPPESMLKRAS